MAVKEIAGKRVSSKRSQREDVKGTSGRIRSGAQSRYSSKSGPRPKKRALKKIDTKLKGSNL